jgi:apolipoprotein N-acyltransferase
VRLLDAIAPLVSELPDPATFPIVAVAGAAGTLLGGLVPRIRRLPPERVTQLTGTGTWAGIGLGFVIWIGAIAIERL